MNQFWRTENSKNVYVLTIFKLNLEQKIFWFVQIKNQLLQNNLKCRIKFMSDYFSFVTHFPRIP
jgi:hypothetical protein